MNHRFVIVATTLVLLTTAPAWGHGTRGVVETDTAIRVSAVYDDGEPMNYAAVEVTAPDSDAPFQKGRTDRNGVFLFSPDSSGLWRIVIHDGLGHRLALDRQIEGDAAAIAGSTPPTVAAATAVSRREGAIAGIAAIFGFFGILYGWKARHSRRV